MPGFTREGLWLAALIVSAALTGLIWTVQLVHYPSFAWVDQERFREFHSFHSTRISWVVAPLMLLEALLTVGLITESLSAANEPTALRVGQWVAAGLVGVVWAVTFAVSVPLHGRLSAGFDAQAWQQLVVSNWVRTCAWTARTVILAALTYAKLTHTLKS